MDISIAINLLIFIFPTYIANAIPVILGGGTKLDFGKNFFDKRRIFGDGKTIYGFFAGICAGIVAGGIISYFTVLTFFPSAKTQFVTFTIMSIGAMIGDAVGSFIKRRIGIEAGKPFILDQLMFLIIALLFAIPTTSSIVYQLEPLLFLFVATYILHTKSNFIANKLGWKNVPW
ncbi:MAG: CDP-2,3-bis-(O-geranylgeranyl)-sn-glycerol synthase [Candidatus Micrarchaeota archaeon]